MVVKGFLTHFDRICISTSVWPFHQALDNLGLETSSLTKIEVNVFLEKIKRFIKVILKLQMALCYFHPLIGSLSYHLLTTKIQSSEIKDTLSM